MSDDWIKPGVTAWCSWNVADSPRKVVITEKMGRMRWCYKEVDVARSSFARKEELYPTQEAAQAARLHAVESRVAEQEKTLARERALRDKIKAELEGKR